MSRYAAVSLKPVLPATFLPGPIPPEFESWVENENEKLLLRCYLKKEYVHLDETGEFQCESGIDGRDENEGVELHFWRAGYLDLTYIGRNLFLEVTLVSRAGLWIR